MSIFLFEYAICLSLLAITHIGDKKFNKNKNNT